MNHKRNLSIEYLRGISMLGVIGIHTGAYSLSNPDVNVHLFALLEIYTRFCVPIFFFISSFGLFYKQDLSQPLPLKPFFLRRSRGVLIPYLLWSLFYMWHYTFISGDFSIWNAPLIYEYFLFGLASYQLYFLVILCWFYLLMPLWRRCLRLIVKSPFRYLSLLLTVQIIFNYYSSYIITTNSDNYYVQQALQYRLSYWVLHYVFIFLLGGVCAVRYDQFEAFIRQKKRWLTYGFAGTLAGMLSLYYLLLYGLSYSPEMAVNTGHQLSPIGVLYTVGATLFWYAVFADPLSPSVSRILGLLGRYSFPAYLIHPLVMYYLNDFMEKHSWVMTAPVTLLFFTATAAFSLLFGAALYRTADFAPWLGELIAGIKKKPIKMGTH